MAKDWYVGDTRYEFPDEFSDQKVHDILVKQGVIKGLSGSGPASGSINVSKTDPPPGAIRKAAGVAGDFIQGVGAGALSTAAHIEEIGAAPTRAALGAVGVGQDKIDKLAPKATDDPTVKKITTPPNSFSGKAGFLGEQAAEFMLAPEADVAKGASTAVRVGTKALREGIKATAIGTAQSGSVKEGLKTGAVGALSAPVAELVAKASGPLKSAAKSIYTRTLAGEGGGSQAEKATIGAVVPEAVARGLWGATWKSMQNKVGTALDAARANVDSKLDELIKQSENTWFFSGTGVKTPSAKEAEEFLNKSVADIHKESGAVRIGEEQKLLESGDAPSPGPKQLPGTSYQEPSSRTKAPPGASKPSMVLDMERGKISTQPILEALHNYAQKFVVDGKVIDKEAHDATIKVMETVADLGEGVSLRSLVKTRRIMDNIVERLKKGGHVIDDPGSAKKEAHELTADAIRAQLGREVPELSAVNKEFSFWKRMETVMDATAKRKMQTTHGSGVIESAMGVATTAVAHLSGEGDLQAVLGGAGVAALTKLIRSTGFKTLSAIHLDKLADVLAAGKAEPAIEYIGYLTKVASRPKDSTGKAKTDPPPPGSGDVKHEQSTVDDGKKKINNGDGSPKVTLGESQARFTRTPINVRYKYDTEETEGEYYPDTDGIKINLGPHPDYAEINHTAAHEQIHALLVKSGLDGKIPNEVDPKEAIEALFKHLRHPSSRDLVRGSNVIDNVNASWNDSSRGGNRYSELPAYLGAFKPGQLKDISAEDRSEWLSLYLKTLPADVRNTFVRIIQNAGPEAAMAAGR